MCFNLALSDIYVFQLWVCTDRYLNLYTEQVNTCILLAIISFLYGVLRVLCHVGHVCQLVQFLYKFKCLVMHTQSWGIDVS